MSKTGAHMINSDDCRALLDIQFMIDSKESYMRTDAENAFKTWFNGYIERLLVSNEKRKEYAKRQQQNNGSNP